MKVLLHFQNLPESIIQKQKMLNSACGPMPWLQICTGHARWFSLLCPAHHHRRCDLGHATDNQCHCCCKSLLLFWLNTSLSAGSWNRFYLKTIKYIWHYCEDCDQFYVSLWHYVFTVMCLYHIKVDRGLKIL